MRSLVVLALLASACSTTSAPDVVAADPAARDVLLSTVAALEGRWEGTGPDGKPAYTAFAVSSGGSAVRELMLVGTEHEMTNMYTLDGNDLVMTHYCAGGNQPFMRANGLEGDRIVFHFEDVHDLKAVDEVYMGEMTLVLFGDDRIEQQWRAFKDGELDHEMTIEMQRVR